MDSRWVNSHPGWQLSLDSGHLAGRALILAVQKLDGRLQTSLLGFSGVFPACVDHHAAHQQTGADAVVTCQVDGQQSSQTFAKGPEDSHGAYSLWLRSFYLRNCLQLFLGVTCAGTVGGLRPARFGFVVLHGGHQKVLLEAYH